MIKERLTLFLIGILFGSFIAINVIAKDHVSATILFMIVMIISAIIIMVGEK